VLLEQSGVLGCFCPSALVFAKLRCGKGAAASAASPAGKCAGYQAGSITNGVGLVLRLIRSNRQNQFAAAFRTFTFLHC